jgi:hypothetical protein
MRSHLQLRAEPGEATLEMVLNCRDLEAKELGNFCQRPRISVDEDDGHALAFGEGAKGACQLRLEPRLGPLRPPVNQWALARTGPALPDPVEVAERTLHPLEPVAMFPRPLECGGRRLPATLEPVGCHEHFAEPRLIQLEELLEA